MRYLIISDLHSNREALDAVLESARGEYDRIVCCGDIAGYGPDPNPVIDWARENLYAAIRDVMVAGRWVIKDRRHAAEEPLGERFEELMRRLRGS